MTLISKLCQLHYTRERTDSENNKVQDNFNKQIIPTTPPIERSKQIVRAKPHIEIIDSENKKLKMTLISKLYHLQYT